MTAQELQKQVLWERRLVIVTLILSVIFGCISFYLFNKVASQKTPEFLTFLSVVITMISSCFFVIFFMPLINRLITLAIRKRQVARMLSDSELYNEALFAKMMLAYGFDDQWYASQSFEDMIWLAPEKLLARFLVSAAHLARYNEDQIFHIMKFVVETLKKKSQTELGFSLESRIAMLGGAIMGTEENTPTPRHREPAVLLAKALGAIWKIENLRHEEDLQAKEKAKALKKEQKKQRRHALMVEKNHQKIISEGEKKNQERKMALRQGLEATGISLEKLEEKIDLP